MLKNDAFTVYFVFTSFESTKYAATLGLVDEFQKWVTLESNESFWA